MNICLFMHYVNNSEYTDNYFPAKIRLSIRTGKNWILLTTQHYITPVNNSTEVKENLL